MGKAYLSFYKLGIKQTWANLKAAKELRATKKVPFRWHKHLVRMLAEERLRHAESRQSSVPAASKAMHATIEAPALQVNDANSDDKHVKALSSLSRAEFQFLHREAGDAIRLPLFVLVLMICGEWTPAIVILFGELVPRTCRIPRQLQRVARKQHQKRIERLSRLSGAVMPTSAVAETPRNALSAVRQAQGQQVPAKEIDADSLTYALAYRLGTYSRLTDIFMLTSRRLTHRLAYLDADDALLLRDSGNDVSRIFEELSLSELRIACDERGIETLRTLPEKDEKGKLVWEDVPAETLRRSLKQWLNGGGWRDVDILMGIGSLQHLAKNEKAA